jgi:hypothetical protein
MAQQAWQAAQILAPRRSCMSDPLIRELDHYVVLEPGRAQQLLSAAETLQWLEQQLSQLVQLPPDLSALPDAATRAQRLLETACELELEPGLVVQWFAIRLEPPADRAAG